MSAYLRPTNIAEESDVVMRVATIAMVSVVLAACSSDIDRAKDALTESLLITTDLEFHDLHSYPGGVVCGSYSAYVSYSEPRQYYQPFLVVEDVLDKDPSSEEQAFYCKDNQSAALHSLAGIGPLTVASAELISITRDMTLLTNALEFYYKDNYYYPTADQGLQALVEKPVGGRQVGSYREGGYLDAIPLDPWGKPYVYEESQWGRTKGDFTLTSLGQSGEAGGTGIDADVSSYYLPYLQHLVRNLGEKQTPP